MIENSSFMVKFHESTVFKINDTFINPRDFEIFSHTTSNIVNMAEGMV